LRLLNPEKSESFESSESSESSSDDEDFEDDEESFSDLSKDVIVLISILFNYTLNANMLFFTGFSLFYM